MFHIIINKSRWKCSGSSHSRTRAAGDRCSDGANSKAAICTCSRHLCSMWLNMRAGEMSWDTRKSQSSCLLLAAANQEDCEQLLPSSINEAEGVRSIHAPAHSTYHRPHISLLLINVLSKRRSTLSRHRLCPAPLQPNISPRGQHLEHAPQHPPPMEWKASCLKAVIC